VARRVHDRTAILTFTPPIDTDDAWSGDLLFVAAGTEHRFEDFSEAIQPTSRPGGLRSYSHPWTSVSPADSLHRRGALDGAHELPTEWLEKRLSQPSSQ
jgi:hypothetical protein